MLSYYGMNNQPLHLANIVFSSAKISSVGIFFLLSYPNNFVDRRKMRLMWMDGLDVVRPQPHTLHSHHLNDMGWWPRPFSTFKLNLLGLIGHDSRVFHNQIPHHPLRRFNHSDDDTWYSVIRCLIIWPPRRTSYKEDSKDARVDSQILLGYNFC